MSLGLPFTLKKKLDKIKFVCYVSNMETQNQIKRTLSTPEAIEQVQIMLDENSDLNRTQFANLVCHRFSFLNPKGGMQISGCMKALRQLEQKGFFVLPATKKQIKKKMQPRRLDAPVAEPIDIPNDITKIKDIELITVETEDHMRIWNELMIQEHPQGAGPLVGRQLRYLISSEYGWLGGIAFSSAALHLEDRDKWIGWNWEVRQKNLHHIVNMSRFLIRNSVKCQNLASHVLGLIVKKIPLDFEKRYGHRPLLLESFVDTSHYKGTCYKAANWQLIGKTKGRGRQDTLKECKTSIKDIYVYPLEKDVKEKIRGKEKVLKALDIYTSIEDEQWAEKEFLNAPLGDKRLSKRLSEIAEIKSLHPGESYSNAAGGDWAKVKGYYRLIDKPEDSEVTMENILQPHRENTIRRMKSEKIVLCVSDTTDLNYNNLDDCEGLGELGSNQTGAVTRGLKLHTVLAVNTKGIPLGIIRSECTAPQKKSKKDKRRPSEIPIEEKKSFCWIKDVRDCMSIKKDLPETQLIALMDREGDFFEMFDDQRKNNPDVEVLVRAQHNRKTIENEKLFDAVKKSPIQAKGEIEISRQSGRKKKSKQKAKDKREARRAEVSIRFKQVKLLPPKSQKEKEAIKVYAIHVLEEKVEKNETPLEWMILTTKEVKTADDAQNCIKWYCLRWRIEDWHRVIKSGCKIEELANKTAERLMRAISINLVVGWRIMLMTLLGRELSDLPFELLFTDIEIEVLKAYAEKKNLKIPKTLSDMVSVVAKLGGYLSRANDSPPGHQLMWKGYKKLQIMCEGYILKGG